MKKGGESMAEIMLTEEQTKKVAESFGTVTVLDPKGNVMGRFDPEWTPEIIKELKRRAKSPGPWFTGEQVQARLRALQEEWDRTGGFDKAYMEDFLKRLDEKDPGHWRTEGQSA